jgi:hypothetical protein
MYQYNLQDTNTTLVQQESQPLVTGYSSTFRTIPMIFRNAACSNYTSNTAKLFLPLSALTDLQLHTHDQRIEGCISLKLDYIKQEAKKLANTIFPMT